eukprot:3935069-Prymnesium_polylepis.3
MSRPRDSAMMRVSALIPSSGRSTDAMLTSVAIASSAVGGTPTCHTSDGDHRTSVREEGGHMPYEGAHVPY